MVMQRGSGEAPLSLDGIQERSMLTQSSPLLCCICLLQTGFCYQKPQKDTSCRAAIKPNSAVVLGGAMPSIIQ